MRIRLYFTLFILSMGWGSAANADWPTLPFPQHAKVESIGERVILNGVPMQMHRILSHENTGKIQQFYQRLLGPRHTLTELDHGVLLAQGRDQHFITIRISPLANGHSETLMTVSDVAAARANRGKPLGIHLPAQTQILSDMESYDQGKRARQLVYQNGYSSENNISFLANTLKQRGYRVQTNTKQTQGNKTLLFEGDRREARLVVIEHPEGSHVVLTMIETNL